MNLWTKDYNIVKSHPLDDFLLQFSCTVLSDSLRPCGLQHDRLPCPSPTLELAQTHVHQVSDVIQPSHPLSSPSPALSFPASGFFAYQWLKDLRDICKCVRLVMNWWSNGKKRDEKRDLCWFPFLEQTSRVLNSSVLVGACLWRHGSNFDLCPVKAATKLPIYKEFCICSFSSDSRPNGEIF